LPVGSSAKTTVGLVTSARERDALLLAAGELGRPMRPAVAEPQPADQLLEPRRLGRATRQPERQSGHLHSAGPEVVMASSSTAPTASFN
jgi:hypothetical protein